jgi:peptide/nickel transport system permease protein
VIVFLLLHLTGDPADLLLPAGGTQEDYAKVRHEMGFDRPIYVQYLDFAGRAVRGDFGISLRDRQPAMGLVLNRLPATLQLAGVALLISLLISIPIGICSALRPGGWLDQVATASVLLGQSIPTFWLGTMLILLIAAQLRLLPASGGGTAAHLVLPGLTLGIYIAPVVTRLLRSSLLEVLREDYIRTARGKGVAERAVVLRHALRNAALPVVTVLGLQIGTLLGGAVITEQVFAYPGMGRLAIQAIASRDVFVVQAFVVVMAVIIVTINLLVDLSYSFIDPRVQTG